MNWMELIESVITIRRIRIRTLVSFFNPVLDSATDGVYIATLLIQ